MTDQTEERKSTEELVEQLEGSCDHGQGVRRLEEEGAPQDRAELVRALDELRATIARASLLEHRRQEEQLGTALRVAESLVGGEGPLSMLDDLFGAQEAQGEVDVPDPTPDQPSGGGPSWGPFGVVVPFDSADAAERASELYEEEALNIESFEDAEPEGEHGYSLDQVESLASDGSE